MAYKTYHQPFGSYFIRRKTSDGHYKYLAHLNPEEWTGDIIEAAKMTRQTCNAVGRRIGGFDSDGIGPHRYYSSQRGGPSSTLKTLLRKESLP